VEWLAAEAAKVEAAQLAGSPLASAKLTEDDRAGASLLDFLASLEEPGADRTLGVARVAVTPSEVVRAQEDLGQRVAARSATSFRTLGDMLTGQVVVRWTSPAETLAEPVRDVLETAAQFEGVARLAHLPAPARARFARDLTPDPNAELAERIRAAFDPRGTFGGGSPVAAAAPATAATKAATTATAMGAGGRR
jgi:hypothetical protein